VTLRVTKFAAPLPVKPTCDQLTETVRFGTKL